MAVRACVDGGAVDIALSLYYNWTTGSSPFAINVETVALHEVGHLLGLAHSNVRKATMYASYTRIDTTLHADDIEEISTLYAASDPNPDPTPQRWRQRLVQQSRRDPQGVGEEALQHHLAATSKQPSQGGSRPQPNL